MDADRRLTAQGQERKQQLLDCAARLFAERGYEETRVIDIVRSAGVAKGLFYWYFDNKDALFEELATSIRSRLRRHQADAIDLDAPALVRLAQGTRASVQFMAEHASFFSLLEVEGRKFVAILRRGTDQHVADTQVVIEDGQREGTIRPEDPRLLALGVVGAVGHYSHFHRTGRLDTPLDELAAFVGRFVVHSVATDPALADEALEVFSRAVQA